MQMNSEFRGRQPIGVAVLFAMGVLFVHSPESLPSTTSGCEPGFTETRWSDHKDRTTTPGLCFNHSRGLYKANLSLELPKCRELVTCPTRDCNTLDHCYTAIKDAYHFVAHAALGLWSLFVHLILTYRRKLKPAKPVLRTVNPFAREFKIF